MFGLLLLTIQDVNGLHANGTFQRRQEPKVGACWTSARDIDMQGLRENWVEKRFQAEAGVRLHAWAYVGGCCRETLMFAYQATGATLRREDKAFPLDPGSNNAAPVEVDGAGLPETHAAHGGEKRPTSWRWAGIVLPVYAAAGEKSLRLLSDQKGFSVARILVGRDPEPPK